MNFQIIPGTILSRNPDILANEIGSETVMMSIQEGKYFGMNKTGSYIWKQLEQPLAFDRLCENIISDFNISRVQCEEEIVPFIEEMTKEKIIDIQ